MLRRRKRTPQPSDIPSVRSDQAQENVASLQAIPHDELPDVNARAALIAHAEAGYDCYAYRPFGSEAHVIWIRPEYCWQDGRMTCAEWIERYQQCEPGEQGGQI